MLSVKVKEGVFFQEFNTFLMEIIEAVSDAQHETGLRTVITSANDGKHMTGSLHYANRALDLRTKDWTPENIKYFASVLSVSLGSRYDVVIEKDHIHVEADRV